MKQWNMQLFFAVSIGFLILSGISCKKDKPLETELEAKEVSIALNLAPDEWVRYRRTDEVDLQSQNKRSRHVKYKVELDYLLRCLSRNEEGVMTIEQIWEHARIKGTCMEGSFDWDSSKEAESIPVEAKRYAGLLNQRIEVDVDRQGRIIDIRGAHMIAQAILEQAELRQRSKSPQECQHVQEEYCQRVRRSLEHVLEGLLLEYPDGVLQPGDAYVTREKGFVDHYVTPKMTLTYEGLRDDRACFLVETALVAQVDPAQNPQGTHEVSMSKEPDKGTMQIDIIHGVVLENEIIRDYKNWGRLDLKLYYELGKLSDMKGTITERWEALEVSWQ